MAISREQPMRPALSDIITLVDSIEEALEEESSDRIEADDSLQDMIGEVASITEAFSDHLRFGSIQRTLAAGTNDTETISFSYAFEEGTIVFVGSKTDDTYTGLTVEVGNETYSGFDLYMENESEDDVSFSVGYFAIGV